MRMWKWFVTAGAMLTAPALVRAEDADLFGKLDANQDGFITPNEVPEEKKGLFERLIRDFDADKDGKLNRKEFETGTTAKPREKAASGGLNVGTGGVGERIDPAMMFKRMDTNSDGKLSKDEAKGPLKEQFDRLDANKDGFIDSAEFAKAAEEIKKRMEGGGKPGEGRPLAGADPKEIFKRLDANGDGKISKDEAKGPISEHFDQIDTNKDGMIDEAEFKAAHERRAGKPGDAKPGESKTGDAKPTPDAARLAEELFKRIDKNGDGKITADEVDAEHKEGFEKFTKFLGTDSLNKEQFTRLVERLRGATKDGAGKPGEGGRSLPMLVELLKKADKNGDGKISKDEAPPFLADKFDRLDTNKDGAIDESEIKAMVEKIREGLPNRKPGNN